MKKKPSKPFKGKLIEWSIQTNADAYTAPELVKVFAIGRLSDDDEHRVRTSAIVKIDVERRRIETLNSIYSLGRMDKSYAAWMKRNKMTLRKFAEKARAKKL